MHTAWIQAPPLLLFFLPQNKVLHQQLVLLNSISDEELTQTIGVICSSMGSAGLACSTAMNALNSLPLVHRWCLAACLKFKFMSRRHTQKESDKAQTRQTDVVDCDTAIVPPSSTWCSGLTSYPRRPDQLIAATNTHMQSYRPAWADAHGAWETKIALHFCSVNLDNKDDSPRWLWFFFFFFEKKHATYITTRPQSNLEEGCDE